MTDEKYPREMVEALRSSIESEEQRGYPSSWHADEGSQQLMEISTTQDWANELNKQGHSIDGIDTNPNDPPDCIAEMDRERIGVEVTELTGDEKERKEYVKAKEESATIIFRAPGQVSDDKPEAHVEETNRNRPKESVPHTADWPFGKFRKKLIEIVQKKDEKMQKKKGKDELVSLDKNFLLIVTSERNLGEERLEEYLNAIELPRPRYFDAIYVMGDYVSKDGDSGFRRVWNSHLKCYDYEEVGPNLGQGYHPVFEVRLA